MQKQSLPISLYNIFVIPRSVLCLLFSTALIYIPFQITSVHYTCIHKHTHTHTHTRTHESTNTYIIIRGYFLQIMNKLRIFKFLQIRRKKHFSKPFMFISYLEFFLKFSYPLLFSFNQKTVTTSHMKTCIHSSFCDSSLHSRLFSLQGTQRDL